MKLSTLLFQIIIILCFFLTIISLSLSSSEPDPQYQWLMLIITFISTVSYFIIRKKIYGNIYWVSIVPIFVLGYLIVFYQMTLLDLVGYELPKRVYYFIWANESVLNKSVGVSTLGLLAFYIGSFLSMKGRLPKKTYTKSSIISTNSIVFVLILAYIFYILFFISSGSYASGVYSAQDASGLSKYFYKLFDISLSAAIIIRLSLITSFVNPTLSLKKYLLFFDKPLLALLFWHLLFSLYVGDRGPVISLSLLTFGLYFIRWKKLRLFQLVIGLFLVSSFLVLVGAARQSGQSGSSANIGYSERILGALSVFGSSDQTSKLFDVYVPGSQFVELSISVNTLNHALYNVPDKYDYRYGLYQMQYIYGLIPGLAGNISTVLYGEDRKFYSSSRFITYLIQGDNHIYGNGTSTLADFYLDFGILGIIIGLSLFGYFVGRNEVKLFSGYQPVTLSFIAILIFYEKSLALNRSSIGQELSNIILIYILIKLNTYIVSHYKNKKQTFRPMRNIELDK